MSVVREGRDFMDSTKVRNGSVRLAVNLVVLLIGAALPVKATNTPDPTSPCNTTDDDARVAAGLAVFREQYCGTCHTLDTAGSAGMFGPTHNGMCSIAVERIRNASYAGSASTAEEYVLESIVNPLAYVVPGYEHTRYRMPAYAQLSEGELDALVILLMQER